MIQPECDFDGNTPALMAAIYKIYTAEGRFAEASAQIEQVLMRLRGTKTPVQHKETEHEPTDLVSLINERAKMLDAISVAILESVKEFDDYI